MAATDLTRERELRRLLAVLRAWGIKYLTAGGTADGAGADTDTDAGEAMDAASFLLFIARAPWARVRDAVVSLVLLHPELADTVARADAEPAVRERLITLALAALYLRRMWWTRLTLALGHAPELAEARFAGLWEERGLPPPWAEHGEAGLRALERWEQGRLGTALSFAGDWQNQVRQLMLQEWSRRANADVLPAVPPIPRPLEAMEQATTEEQEYAAMSMRPPVDRARIEIFLRRLGQAVRQPGQVYLVGGAELVHGQVRGPAAATVDIDLWLDVRDEHEVQTALQQLKNALDVNVELASPGDFIPLPAAWRSAARYVGRYGPLDVFYFDFYSLALSKIERGTERDLEDVELLARQGLVTRERLDAAFQEILPQMGMGRYFNVDARRFAAQYAAAMRRVWGDEP